MSGQQSKKQQKREEKYRASPKHQTFSFGYISLATTKLSIVHPEDKVNIAHLPIHTQKKVLTVTALQYSENRLCLLPQLKVGPIPSTVLPYGMIAYIVQHRRNQHLRSKPAQSTVPPASSEAEENPTPEQLSNAHFSSICLTDCLESEQKQQEN